MPLPVVFTRRAAREVEEASEWWQANRAGSPDALAVDLAAALSLIANEPRCGVPVVGIRLDGVRRVLLARVHYHLYYRIAQPTPRIEILAFWHQRRTDPSL